MSQLKIGIVLLLAGAMTCQVQMAHADMGGAGPKQLVSPPSDQPPKFDSGGDNNLRLGVVTAVDATGDRIEIHGRWHRIDATRTRFVRDGRVVRSDSLKKGQSLKFTLLAGQGENSTLGVVYVP